MAMFEDVVSRVKSVAETAGRKTGELVELGKIKIKIADLQREVSSAQEGLGRLVYDSRISGQSVEDMIDACVAHITELQSEIEELEEKVLESKNAVRCADCGVLNESTATYCNRCGAKL